MENKMKFNYLEKMMEKATAREVNNFRRSLEKVIRLANREVEFAKDRVDDSETPIETLEYMAEYMEAYIALDDLLKEVGSDNKIEGCSIPDVYHEMISSFAEFAEDKYIKKEDRIQIRIINHGRGPVTKILKEGGEFTLKDVDRVSYYDIKDWEEFFPISKIGWKVAEIKVNGEVRGRIYKNR